MLHIKPTEIPSTVTCYSYDDLENWYDDRWYTEDAFENQWELLCEKWKRGLDIIADIPPCDFTDVSAACYISWKSVLNQIKFIRARDRGETYKMIEVLELEENCALEIYKIMLRNPCIGYEAANQYFYDRAQIVEKILNCRYILNQLKKQG